MLSTCSNCAQALVSSREDTEAVHGAPLLLVDLHELLAVVIGTQVRRDIKPIRLHTLGINLAGPELAETRNHVRHIKGTRGGPGIRRGGGSPNLSCKHDAVTELIAVLFELRCLVEVFEIDAEGFAFVVEDGDVISHEVYR